MGDKKLNFVYKNNILDKWEVKEFSSSLDIDDLLEYLRDDPLYKKHYYFVSEENLIDTLYKVISDLDKVPAYQTSVIQELLNRITELRRIETGLLTHGYVEEHEIPVRLKDVLPGIYRAYKLRKIKHKIK